MHEWVTKSRRLASLLGLMTLVLALPACGGSSGGGSSPPPPVTCSFVASDAGAAPNTVRMAEGAAPSGNLCFVDVAIGGATTDSNYYAFAFDVEISDTTVAQFVAGSDTIGTFLTGTADSLASTNGNHVVVGVSKSGQIAGNGTANAEEVVVSLTFRVLKAGTATLTFTGSPNNPALNNCSPTGPEAIEDAPPAGTGNGGCIATTVFSVNSATISGS